MRFWNLGRKYRSLWVALATLLSSCTTNQPTNVLILPEDRAEKDQQMYAGTREFFGLAGLSRVDVPGRDDNLYVVDRQVAARRHVTSALTRMPRDAYISIHQDQGLLTRSVQVLQSQDGSRHIQYRHFEDALLGQLGVLFDEKEQPEGNESVEFVEYRFAMGECAGLSSAFEAVENGLRDAVNRIGVALRFAPGEVEEVMVDGPGYMVEVRMQRLTGRFPVGGNSGPVFDRVEGVLNRLRECAAERPGARLRFSLYGSGAVETIYSSE